MSLSSSQIERIAQLRERQEESKSFSDALKRLRESHQDMGYEQFQRWEGYLVDRDELALGGAIAMMDVRDWYRKGQSLYYVI